MRKDNYLKAPASNLFNWETLDIRKNCQPSRLLLTLFYNF